MNANFSPANSRSLSHSGSNSRNRCASRIAVFSGSLKSLLMRDFVSSATLKRILIRGPTNTPAATLAASPNDCKQLWSDRCAPGDGGRNLLRVFLAEVLGLVFQCIAQRFRDLFANPQFFEKSFFHKTTSPLPKFSRPLPGWREIKLGARRFTGNGCLKTLRVCRRLNPESKQKSVNERKVASIARNATSYRFNLYGNMRADYKLTPRQRTTARV